MKNLKKTLLVVSLVLCCNTAFLQIENAHPIDVQCEACLDSVENQSTLGMIDCERKAMASWNVELNKYYNLLLPVLDKSEQTKFKKAQKAWLAYKKAETDFSDNTYYNEQGTLYQIFAASKASRIVKARVIELMDYYSDFTYQE